MAILNYESVREDNRPSMRQALLFCAPGAICELAPLAGAILSLMPVPFPAVVKAIAGQMVLISFFAAVLTCFVSLMMYLPKIRQRQPWYVYLKLFINMGGIVIGLGLLALVFVVGVGPGD